MERNISVTAAVIFSVILMIHSLTCGHDGGWNTLLFDETPSEDTHW